MIAILLAVAVAVAANADEREWQQRCTACSLHGAKCELRTLTDREIAEIHLQSVPENGLTLNDCGDVDVLHVDFQLNYINSPISFGNTEVDTLILSNVSSFAPDALSEISPHNANSIIFSDINELCTDIPRSGRIGFTGPLDESVLAIFPKGPMPRDDAMSIIFKPSFSGLLGSPIHELPNEITSLLIEVSTADQFLLLTENIVKLNPKPIINVIINTDDDNEEDFLDKEFIQRIADLASAVQIQPGRPGIHSFPLSSIPKRLLLNIIRCMFIIYSQLRDRPEASELEVCFRTENAFNEAVNAPSGVHFTPNEFGFLCRVNIKQLFEQCEGDYLRTKGYDPNYRQALAASQEIIDPITNRKRNSQSKSNSKARNKSRNRQSIPPGISMETNNFKNGSDRKGSTSHSDIEPLSRGPLGISKKENIISRDHDVENHMMKSGNIHEELQLETQACENKAVDVDSQRYQSGSDANNCESSTVEQITTLSNTDHSQEQEAAVTVHDVGPITTLSNTDHCQEQDAAVAVHDVEQITTLSNTDHPQEQEAAIAVHDLNANPSESGSILDSPAVMISIIASSVIVLTVALIVIFVLSKRRRLQRSAKLQSPTSCRNETDPETLWW